MEADELINKIKGFSVVSYYQGQYDELHSIIYALSTIKDTNLTIKDVLDFLELCVKKAEDELEKQKNISGWQDEKKHIV